MTRYPTVCCLTKTDDFQNDPHFGVLICLSADKENGFWSIRGLQDGCSGTKLDIGVYHGDLKGLCVGNWECAGEWAPAGGSMLIF
eukprot:1160894-Pelagomonas_calceolata.AAC.9